MPDPDGHPRHGEVGRLIVLARVHDRELGRLAALIVTALHAGLRVESPVVLRWLPREKNADGLVYEGWAGRSIPAPCGGGPHGGRPTLERNFHQVRHGRGCALTIYLSAIGHE